MASSVATPLERQFGHIAGVSQMTSSSTLGVCSVTLQFDLSRDVDGAARDVEAGHGRRAHLPACQNLPANPQYRKINSALAPVMVLDLTSPTRSKAQLYDTASSVIQQKLSQVEGVGQVQVVGSSLPAVRIDANPQQLNSYGLGLQDLCARDQPAELQLARRPDLRRLHHCRHRRQRPDFSKAADLRCSVVG